MSLKINLKEKQKIVLGSILLITIVVSSALLFIQNSNQKKDARASFTAKVYRFGKEIKDNSTQTIPTENKDLAGYIKVDTDGNSFFASTTDNKTFSFGQNIYGELANNSFQTEYQSNFFNLQNAFSQLKVNNSTILGVTNSGDLKSWGSNSCSRLGSGDAPQIGIVSIDNQNLQSKNAIPATPLQTNVNKVAIGKTFAISLLNNSNLYSWGCNPNGELGLGNRTGYNSDSNPQDRAIEINNDKLTPTQITFPVDAVSSVGGQSSSSNANGIKSIAAGDNFALALKNDGTVYSWGANETGQLGQGSFTGENTTGTDSTTGEPIIAFVDNNKLSPTKISSLSNIKEVYAGSNFAYALSNDGKLYSWGGNENGRLGINSKTEIDSDSIADDIIDNNQLSPAEVTGVSGIQDIATGNDFTLALNSTGDVYSWGANQNGQLGLGDNEDKLVPTKIPTLSKVQSISAGGQTAFAIVQEEVVAGSSSSVSVNNSSSNSISSNAATSSTTSISSSNSATSTSNSASTNSSTNLSSVSSSNSNNSANNSASTSTSVSSSQTSSAASVSVAQSSNSVSSVTSSVVSSAVSSLTNSSITNSVSSNPVSSVTSSSVNNQSSNSSSSNFNPNTRLLNPASVVFSPDKANAPIYKRQDLSISVKNNSSILEGSSCVFRGKEYPTGQIPNPSYQSLGTVVYTNGNATAKLTTAQQTTPKWDFDIQCTNPIVNGNPLSGLIFGNNPGYLLKYGAISVVEIRASVV